MSTTAQMPVILTIIYRMRDGSYTSMHRHFDAGESWSKTVMEALGVVRAQEAKYPGCVVTAHLYNYQPHDGGPGLHPQAALSKTYQPHEWAAA